MTLYFLRHGQSLANLQGQFAGQRDNSPLTELGIQQAKDAAKIWKEKGIPLHKIVTSPLIRAQKTAEIFAEDIEHLLEILIDKRIIEYDMGDLTGKPNHDISSEKLFGVEGAEDTDAFIQRVRSALQEYDVSDQNILLVSHAGVMRMVYCIRDRIESRLFYDYKLPRNAEIIALDF